MSFIINKDLKPFAILDLPFWRRIWLVCIEALFLAVFVNILVYFNK